MVKVVKVKMVIFVFGFGHFDKMTTIFFLAGSEDIKRAPAMLIAEARNLLQN